MKTIGPLAAIFLFCIADLPAFAQTPVIHSDLVSAVYSLAVLPAGEQPIRMVTDGTDLYYASLLGDIKKVDLPGGVLTTEYTTADHGLEQVFGMEYYNGKLYLTGLVSSGDTAWVGYLQSIELGTGLVTNLAYTDTLYIANGFYDHRFNFVLASPTGQHLYVHIASRTNHGEVQELAGAGGTAGLREHYLTGKIFRLPISPGSAIHLQDDSLWVANSPYLFAQGLRNAFAPAFDASGNFYVAMNSDRRDVPEPVYRLQGGEHCGFPHQIAGFYNPLRDDSYQPELDTLLKDPPANNEGFYDTDPAFPEPAPGLVFKAPLLNLGPDADQWHNAHTDAVYDASDLGVTLNGISGHKSPTSMVFDRQQLLPDTLNGGALLTCWSPANSVYMYDIGEDLLLMRPVGSVKMSMTRLVSGFSRPMSVVLVGSTAYVLDLHRIWEVHFQASPLPVALLRWEAAGVCRIELSWEVGEEVDLAHYELQRMREGGAFRAIGLVSAQGRSRYAFLDTPPEDGLYFYRLKMMDLDGRFSYSEVLSAPVDCAVELPLRLSPNPANALVRLSASGEFRVFPQHGGPPLLQGEGEEIDVRSLPPGLYWVMLTSDGGRVEAACLVKGR